MIEGLIIYGAISKAISDEDKNFVSIHDNSFVFPNPLHRGFVNGMIKHKKSGKVGVLKAEIFDLSPRKIREFYLETDGETFFHIADLGGTYLLKITEDGITKVLTAIVIR